MRDYTPYKKIGKKEGIKMKHCISVFLAALLGISSLIPLLPSHSAVADVPAEQSDYLTDTSDRENFPQFPNEGAVRVDKDVVDTSIYNQTGVAQIELQVAGISETEPVDVVLVIDTSASMDDIPSGDTVSKMVSAKAAAKNFVASLVKNADGTFNENRVAIVEFFDYAVEISGMTHVKSATELTALQNKITAIDATEGGGNPDDNDDNTVPGDDWLGDDFWN